MKLVVDLVDVLVDAAPLPEDVRATDLTGVLLLVDHGPAVLARHWLTTKLENENEGPAGVTS